ncbi:hypothetical protein AMAG_00828 [Allomyces macrogynus ATCC 38327]|uniref:Uncharacterized protein n=1 Tax=Allomyces macrogynus (strain ATCC 38327) TaxID=578462 RepID=A0A0L0RWW0_ALLM3|nr:hypothetical protein AMAG_00828 [Allomyces macrogynus ATCC 38327]|eukprot:KNE54882.1 hypothetical protein AMAG_00828 [Allomyces macrogynus ATCC 38327]
MTGSTPRSGTPAYPTLRPPRNFEVVPVRVNNRGPVLHAIQYQKRYYLPLITISNAVVSDGETLYNRLRKKLGRKEHARMLLEDEDLVRYRTLSKTSSTMKLFTDERTMNELMAEANVAARCSIRPVHTDEDGNVDGNDDDRANDAEGDDDEDDDEDAAMSDANHDGENGAEAGNTPEPSDGEPPSTGLPPPRRRTWRSSTSSKAAPATPAAASASVPVAATPTTASALYPPGTPRPDLYTPYTLDIKISRRGTDPHFVMWADLSALEKFLVFKAALESKDAVLERKRPWMARFLAAAFTVDDFTHFEQKLQVPFRARVQQLVATHSYVSDMELGAAAENRPVVAELKRRANEDQQQGNESLASKRRKTSPADPLPSHLQYMQEALQPPPATTDPHAPPPPPLDAAMIHEQLHASRHTVQALVHSMGSFYYDLTFQSAALNEKIDRLQTQADRVPVLEQAVETLQRELAELKQRLGVPPAPASAEPMAVDAAPTEQASGAAAVSMGSPAAGPPAAVVANGTATDHEAASATTAVPEPASPTAASKPASPGSKPENASSPKQVPAAAPEVSSVAPNAAPAAPATHPPEAVAPPPVLAE